MTTTRAAGILASLGLDALAAGDVESRCPATGERLARVPGATAAEYERAIAAAQSAFARWRDLPAPQRGEIVRQIGVEFRARKDALGALIALEMGKVRSEGLGEVQEVIDICDFATGL